MKINICNDVYDEIYVNIVYRYHLYSPFYLNELLGQLVPLTKTVYVYLGLGFLVVLTGFDDGGSPNKSGVHFSYISRVKIGPFRM